MDLINQITDYLMPFMIVWGFSLILIISHAIIKYLKINIKDKRIKVILEFAEQAVIFAERTNLVSETKKEIATNILNKRLQDNKLTSNVTVEQIDQYIEKAVIKLNLESQRYNNNQKVNKDIKADVDYKLLTKDEALGLINNKNGGF